MKWINGAEYHRVRDMRQHISLLLKILIIVLAALVAMVPLSQLMRHDDLDGAGMMALLQYAGIVAVAASLFFLVDHFLKTGKAGWKKKWIQWTLLFLLLPFAFVVMLYGGAALLVFIFFGYGAYVIGLTIQKKMRKGG